MTYSVMYKGQTVVAPSALGIVLDGQSLGQNAHMQKPIQRGVNEKYNVATHGVHTTAINQYQFAAIPLTSGTNPVRWTLELRVYNDGRCTAIACPVRRHVSWTTASRSSVGKLTGQGGFLISGKILESKRVMRLS